MLVQGNCYKVGNQWLAEIPLIKVVISSSPGGDRSDLMDCVCQMAKQSNIKVSLVEKACGDKFFLRVESIDQLLPVILRRTRLTKKLSMGDVTKRLGYSSRNAYAQYEYGKTKLTFAKYVELMGALDSTRETVLSVLH